MEVVLDRNTKLPSMTHTLTLQTKFTFGDRVRFDSQLQSRRGTGTIFAITIDSERRIDYLIQVDGTTFGELQPGILEEEIELEGDQ
jgi:hypothetical protein